MLRGLQRPFLVGETVRLSDLAITITEVAPDGRAQEALFRFARPLESPEWLWMRGEGPALVPWTPPPIGVSEVLMVRML